MPLRRHAIHPEADAPLPDRVHALIEAGEQRGAAVIDALGSRLLGYVPSDFEVVYRALLALRAGQPVGDRFCEWGSGLGVVTGLAALAGFDASGIEIQRPLVEVSRQLLEDCGIDAVEIYEGSFIPEEFELESRDGTPLDLGRECVTVVTGSGSNDEVVDDIEDFDVIFAFPWPGEEELYLALFDSRAAAGALLVTYHGPTEGVMVHVKETVGD